MTGNNVKTNFLDGLAERPLGEMVLGCRELLEDDNFPTVKRWREAGGKVLGHFQVYFPEELAHAAGVLPVKIHGFPGERREADSHFGSYLCSILRSSLEIVLSKRMELDMFVSHPICDAARNLAAIWSRNFDYPCHILYLPQNANSAHAAEYLRAEYARISREIESIGVRPITDEALHESLLVFNENRRLLRELYDIKRETPWLVSVDEAYVLTSVGCLIPREEHNHLLSRAIELMRERGAKKQDKLRVVFEGGFCEQPPLDLLGLLGRACYVVDDDLLIGMRWILTDVPTTGDPLLNLAKAYLESSSYSPVQHDLRKPKEKMLLERIRGAHGEAAIVMAAKMCEPGLDEQVAYAKALDEAQIPYIVGEFEETMNTFDTLETQLETFVENIMFD